MRAKLFIFIIIVMTILGCQKGSSFKEFVSQEGRFSVLMPGDPTEEIQAQNTAVGVINTHSFMVELEDATYTVAYTDYPIDMIDNSDPDILLDDVRDGAVSGAEGVLLSELLLTLDNYPGRELKVEADGGKMKFQMRIFLVENRLYQILVGYQKEGAFSMGASDFLDSFMLL